MDLINETFDCYCSSTWGLMPAAATQHGVSRIEMHQCGQCGTRVVHGGRARLTRCIPTSLRLQLAMMPVDDVEQSTVVAACAC